MAYRKGIINRVRKVLAILDERGVLRDADWAQSGCQAILARHFGVTRQHISVIVRAYLMDTHGYLLHTTRDSDDPGDNLLAQEQLVDRGDGLGSWGSCRSCQRADVDKLKG